MMQIYHKKYGTLW